MAKITPLLLAFAVGAALVALLYGSPTSCPEGFDTKAFRYREVRACAPATVLQVEGTREDLDYVIRCSDGSLVDVYP